MNKNLSDQEILDFAFHYIAKKTESSKFRSILDTLKGRELLNSKNQTGCSLADACIIIKKPRLLLSLLYKGFIIDNSENSLLQYALNQSDNDNDPIIDILIRYNADVNHINKRKRSLLHTAVANPHCENMHKLLKAGANPNILDNNGYSPLSNALHYKKSNMVEILLNYPIENHLNNEGKDLFIVAIKYHSKYVIPMIESGIKMIPINENGYHTLLDYFSTNYPKGLSKIIEYCTPEQLNIKSRYQRQYLIHDVASRRQYDILLKMIAYGADATLMNNNNESVLYCMVKGESRFTPKIKKVINVLLTKSINWNNANLSGTHILDVIQNEQIKNYLLTYEKELLKSVIPTFNEKTQKIKRI